MREQNFGIEIEMTGITRNAAAKVIAKHFGTEAVHVGGTYDTYTVPDGQDRRWKVVRDGSIRCQARGQRSASALHSVEFVSPVCKYGDIPTIQELVRELRHAGAMVNDSCGIHVHVDASRHDAKTLRNVVNIMASKEDLLYKTLKVNIDREYYCCSEQAGKPVAQRVEEFNAANAPFRLMDFEDGHYSLSLNISFLEPPYTNYGQQAFDAYAELGGAPAQQNGLFVRGSGYDWESVFQKVFENDPLLRKVELDSEAGGFYCYSRDLSVLEDLGSRFKTLCDDGQAFTELVCKALMEADQRQQMQWGGL